MISTHQLQATADAIQYQCRSPVNLYDSPNLDRLATQAAAGRYLQLLSSAEQNTAVEVRLCEDEYPGWLSLEDLTRLDIADRPYQPAPLTAAEIQAQIPAAIAFTKAAMNQPNQYLWGGTIPPNYDCSGLMQAAFASVGIWLPRDAYQQEAFTQSIALSELQPGDLVFFGTAQKATHVGLCLGDGHYIHSSGRDQGHNGIAIDVLSDEGNAVSRRYYAQLRGAGRITSTYYPAACQ